MKAKKILYPTDFSTCSEAGLQQATALARDAQARLLIIHVQEPPVYGDIDAYYEAIEPDNLALLNMLHAVRPTDPTVPYEHRLLTGDPAEEIARFAEEAGCSLIVMGTHGRTGFERLLMGSVAEAVVRLANCGVVTCKHPRLAPGKTKAAMAVQWSGSGASEYESCHQRSLMMDTKYVTRLPSFR
jgi:nucleotide-binding universal stress UspA family protein